MAEFAGAGQKEGLQLWRIENFKPVEIPRVTGKFYTGDSYILLSTVLKNNKFLWNIHFWLGSETSEDESGTAAYKTVELDDKLGGSPVQYREVQGNESALFLSYFKNSGGIEYAPGGISSGFKHVEKDVYETRLLHLKGARTVRVSQVPVSNKSLNKGDVFILDTGLIIYIFNGPTSNRLERSKGVEVASRIDNDERSGRAQVVFLDDNINDQGFWGPLGGFINPASLPEGESDNTVVETKVATKLFKIDGNNAFASVALPSGKPTKDQLTSADVFLLHASKLYIWVGSSAPLAKKREATASAVKYIKSAGLPASTAIERVSEGVETSAFKGEFAKWEVQITVKSGIAQAKGDANIDVKALLARKQIEETPFDDGSGKLEVFLVSNFDLVPVSADKFGQFFGGDSYIVLYTYKRNGKEEYFIYFWLGDASSIDEKGTAALKAKELDDARGGRPVQVRVTQGKEPAHFRQLFKGKMVIHKGGKASSFGNTTEKDSYDTDGTALFRVHGSTPLNTLGVQVEEKASSLNSGDVFVLVTPSHVYQWQGSLSTADEKKVAAGIADVLARDYNGQSGRVSEVVPEGSEPGEFWAALGGADDYSKVAAGEDAPAEPRLFECSNATGSFTINEIADFSQTDLNDEDIYLLDTKTAVYLWVGSQSNEAERTKSIEYANKFVAEATDGRDANVPVITVKSAEEPFLFSSQFVTWDSQYAEKNKFVDPYQAKLDKLAAEKAKSAPAASAPAPAAAKAPAAAPAAKGFYSFEEVKAGSVAGMDLSSKENYLDDATFKAKLGVERAAFAALPKWKRDAKKKEVGIF